MLTSVTSYTCSVDQQTFVMPSDDSGLPGGSIAIKANGTIFKICDDCLDYLWRTRNPAYQSRNDRGILEIPTARESEDQEEEEAETESVAATQL